MSTEIQIYLALTGQRFSADPVTFASLDALRSWVSRHAGISAQNQILMTSRGKQVKAQTLLTEREIFIFDRQFISPQAPGSPKPAIPRVPTPPDLSSNPAPDTLASQTDLQAWQTLFKSRRTWALEIAENCRPMFEAVGQHYNEVHAIDRAVAVAMTNVETHVSALEQKRLEAHSWAQDIVLEQETTLNAWKSTLESCNEIRIIPDFLRIFSLRGVGSKSDKFLAASTNGRAVARLSDLADAGELNAAAEVAQDVLKGFGDKLSELDRSIDAIMKNSLGLSDQVRDETVGSTADASQESARLLEDIEVVAKKVASDYEHVLTLSESSKSISQVSKMALLNTRNYLPTLSECSQEMVQLHQRAVSQRNASTKAAVHHLQTISMIESKLSAVNSQLTSMSVSPGGLAAIDLLTAASRLPSLYGSFLLESVRRWEWNEKVKTDSSVIAEELATYREEEERRRRKWQRTVSEMTLLNFSDSKALGVEINLHGDAQQWPQVERQDLERYLDSLSRFDTMDDARKDLSNALAELDRPTRQQVKRLKAFKQGSLHEATLGGSTLLLRGDNDAVRSLRDEKLKLEDKLKGSESRVRKLEDLVHRHSQMSRTTSGNVFQSTTNYGPEQHSTSPRTADTLSRRSSVSSRRLSTNLKAEERTLAQRLVAVEAELNAERERTAGLQREFASKEDDDKTTRHRLQEADSTKKDLMDNLEAQQREFADERRLLEDDNSKLRARLDELEDELDRLLGSREQEKARSGQDFQKLEAELVRVKEESSKIASEGQQQVHVHRSSAVHLQEKAECMETVNQQLNDRLQRSDERRSELEVRLQSKIEEEGSNRIILQSAHRQLAPDDVAPSDLIALSEGFEVLVQKSRDHIRDVENNLTVVLSENESLRTQASEAEERRLALEHQISSEALATFKLRETLAEERGKAAAALAELDEERLQLKALRDKFADGQTGSEELRERITEGESKATELATTLAAQERQIEALREELGRRQRKIEILQAATSTDASRLGSRTSRATDLTRRLYSQNDRLTRLLESLGFSVLRRDGSMVVQRVPRNTSNNGEDINGSMNRSMSGSISTKKTLESSGDLALLSWMHAEDPSSELEKYEAFVNAFGNFDADVFSDTILKRVKEAEHLARKWQKEARGYRDKAHRAQGECHEKIAYRSFKEGDLALFLPTRNQATRPWAAFNVGAPHYFLREQDSHKLKSRDWLLARISKVEERLVDLSKSIHSTNQPGGDRRSIGESSDGAASYYDDENPFELSDGLRWYLLDASEEKPGAPSTPGLGKSTVASAHVDAKGSMRVDKISSPNGVSKRLSKSLDSRRNSSNSKKSVTAVLSGPSTAPGEVSRPSTSAADAAQEAARGVTTAAAAAEPEGEGESAGGDAGGTEASGAAAQEVRKDLLWGP
ncbi:MAG: oligomeric, coiled-coil, peripheral membrane protein [Piccolia ochrophora]|nr:MAG: oligomeric, coiled-coil, peripheral membrane protein [Piccolia ochrophora]